MVESTGLSVVREQSAISVYDRVEPMEFIEKMGKVFAMTGAGGAKTESDGKLLALACVSRRMDVFELGQTYHLISGKLVKKADVMLGDFRRAGGKHRWIKDGTDGQSATLELQPKGEQATQYTFTIEMARAAGYVKSGEKGDSQWVKRPDQMLRARCITDLIGMVAPELRGGDYSEEEILDVTADVKPSGKAKTEAAPRSADEVTKRRAELTGAPVQQDTVIDVEPEKPQPEKPPFDGGTQATSSSTTTSTSSATPSSVPQAAHQQQSELMEIELMVSRIPGATIQTLIEMANAQRAAKNKPSITNLGQLEPEAISAMATNLRAAIAKSQQAGQQTPNQQATTTVA